MTRYERAVYNMICFGLSDTEHVRHEHTWMAMFLPFGDQLIDTFSPCSANDVDVRVRCASIAEGYMITVIRGLVWILRNIP